MSQSKKIRVIQKPPERTAAVTIKQWLAAPIPEVSSPIDPAITKFLEENPQPFTYKTYQIATNIGNAEAVSAEGGFIAVKTDNWRTAKYPIRLRNGKLYSSGDYIIYRSVNVEEIGGKPQYIASSKEYEFGCLWVVCNCRSSCIDSFDHSTNPGIIAKKSTLTLQGADCFRTFKSLRDHLEKLKLTLMYPQIEDATIEGLEKMVGRIRSPSVTPTQPPPPLPPSPTQARPTTPLSQTVLPRKQVKTPTTPSRPDEEITRLQREKEDLQKALHISQAQYEALRRASEGASDKDIVINRLTSRIAEFDNTAEKLVKANTRIKELESAAKPNTEEKRQLEEARREIASLKEQTSRIAELEGLLTTTNGEIAIERQKTVNAIERAVAAEQKITEALAAKQMAIVEKDKVIAAMRMQPSPVTTIKKEKPDCEKERKELEATKVRAEQQQRKMNAKMQALEKELVLTKQTMSEKLRICQTMLEQTSKTPIKMEKSQLTRADIDSAIGYKEFV